MGFVSFVLVVGALGFAVWLVLGALKRHDARLDQQNAMLAQLLGYQTPQPPAPSQVNWQGLEQPAQPVQQTVTQMVPDQAFWGQRP